MKKIYKIENGILYEAEKIPVERKSIGNCYYCRLPVLVSEGQLLKFFRDKPTHKKCRK